MCEIFKMIVKCNHYETLDHEVFMLPIDNGNLHNDDEENRFNFVNLFS